MYYRTCVRPQAVHWPARSKEIVLVSLLAQTLAEIQEAAEHAEPCTFGRILSKVDNDDREALESILRSRASTRAIHRALRDAGWSIERVGVTLHREGRCRCFENGEQS